MDIAPDHVASLMQNLRKGSHEAAGQLVALFYPELRKLAHAHMRREGSPHTWQPTVLVNELYLELVKIKALGDGPAELDDRRAFFGLAAHLMKRLLIHHARPLPRRAAHVEVSEDLDFGNPDPEELASLENLLAGLEEVDADLRTIVELKVFEGLAIEEIAAHLNTPARTVYRRWALARTWLSRHLSE
jgi:RNA polymerase sigma factor (TIGR02999 family)